MDITQLILDDHHEQRRLFAMLDQIDRGDVEALRAIWTRLSTFLEVHAEAEEELFYPELLRLGKGAGGTGNAKAETRDAIHDHNEIRDAIAAAGRQEVGGDDWYAAIAKVNKANGDHMAEEESEGLSDFRRHAGVQTRHDLAVAFAAFEASHVSGVRPVDKSPRKYVADHE